MIYNSRHEEEGWDLIAPANGNRVKKDFNVDSVSNVFLPVKT